jgi:polar amino acid transport system permease protein
MRSAADMLEKALYGLPFLWQGLLISLEAAVIVVVISLGLGVVLGIAITYGPRLLAWPIRAFSDIIRGIPILVLMFFVFYGLPVATGGNIGNFAAGLTALALFSTAQVIEICRGALQSIARGQMEAAKAVGLTFPQRMAYVILPQAVRRFLPPWINSVTDTVKGTALLSLVGIVDLMQAIQQVIGRTYEALPLYILGALIYFVINYSLSSLSRVLEARFAYVRE